jgi:hypothetical protein
MHEAVLPDFDGLYSGSTGGTLSKAIPLFRNRPPDIPGFSL